MPAATEAMDVAFVPRLSILTVPGSARTATALNCTREQPLKLAAAACCAMSLRPTSSAVERGTGIDTCVPATVPRKQSSIAAAATAVAGRRSPPISAGVSRAEIEVALLVSLL